MHAEPLREGGRCRIVASRSCASKRTGSGSSWCRMRRVPVVAACVVYHVGSRNEAVGHTGSTHLLEHLMFKGSRTFDPADGRPVARVLERVGASFNATTWFDRTNYYETLPPEHLELALELEADRMRARAPARGGPGLRDDRRAQRVRARRERPVRRAAQGVVRRSRSASTRTTTRRSAGGATSRRPRSSACATFYDTFYYPDNATLVLVGAFDRDEALALVGRHFGRAAAGAAGRSRRVVTREPAPGGGAPLRGAPGRRGRLGGRRRGACPRPRTPTPTPSRCSPTRWRAA